jgi:hypothetical protein
MRWIVVAVLAVLLAVAFLSELGVRLPVEHEDAMYPITTIGASLGVMMTVVLAFKRPGTSYGEPHLIDFVYVLPLAWVASRTFGLRPLFPEPTLVLAFSVLACAYMSWHWHARMK